MIADSQLNFGSFHTGMKKNIALLAGGYSGEYVISLQSAETIERHLDTKRYRVFKIIVTREGFHYTQDGRPYQVDLNDFSITLPEGKILFEAAFIAIHGTPGEDGRLQGYLDMIGLPYTTCSSIVSALTFNKSFCNKVVKDFGVVHIASSAHLIKGEPYSLGAIMEELKLPVFVKPNESGSSLGVSKVKAVEDLLPAIEKAFREDKEVLIEEFISGRELTIGVYRVKGKLVTLPPTEIVSKNEFFDYEAKYTTGVTDEITPAPIPESLREQLEQKAAAIYRLLNCRGIVRMDFIWQQPEEKLYFLEVNTMPGQSANSLIPQQVRAAGLSLSEFYNSLLEEVLPVESSADVSEQLL